MKPTISNIRRLATKLGAEVDHCRDETSVMAPDGMCWACDPHVHNLLAVHESDPFWGSASHKCPEAYADLLARMQDGLMQCDCDDCLRNPKPVAQDRVAGVFRSLKRQERRERLPARMR